MPNKNLPDYAALKAELDDILDELRRGDADVAEAIKQYERGLQIVKELEQYLEDAQNTVTRLHPKASGE